MSSKGKGGKKHRRGKNISIALKPNLPDPDQYYAYITKILGNGRMELNYYIPIYKEDSTVGDWNCNKSIGLIRGKMMKRVYVNLNDLVLVSEREFDKSKVDIIDKYNSNQIPYLKKESNFPDIGDLAKNDIEFNFSDNDNIKKDISGYCDYLKDMPSFSDDE